VLQPNPFWVPADLCSPQAYGHTGYTGTSLLLDPVAGIFAVLLTNRVHPSRENGSAGAVREVRARFHNAVWAALAG
jgi:CubicO group peptidase (beta-lactamase class C family)